MNITIDQITPDMTGVLKTQGVPPGTEPSERVKTLYRNAEQRFLELAAPKAVIADISIEAFDRIYPGEGNNAPDTPLEKIYPKADHLALFAFTLGPAVSQEIQSQFDGNGLAVGYMMDAIASFSADKASEVAQAFFLDRLASENETTDKTYVLLYSPGYCGWHISGQGKLFGYLKPDQIGISLNPSYLMTPLKSISGVLVAGDAGIHRFLNNYDFCAQCKTKSCRPRVHALPL